MPVDLVTFKMVDDRGKSKSAVFPIAAGHTLVDIGTFVVVMAANVDAISGLAIADASIQLSLTLPGTVKTTPTPKYRTDEGGLFAFSVTGSEYRTSVYIPGVLDTMRNGDDIPTSFTEIDDFVTAMETGPGVAVTDKHANPIDSFLGGRYTQRK